MASRNEDARLRSLSRYHTAAKRLRRRVITVAGHAATCDAAYSWCRARPDARAEHPEPFARAVEVLISPRGERDPRIEVGPAIAAIARGRTMQVDASGGVVSFDWTSSSAGTRLVEHQCTCSCKHEHVIGNLFRCLSSGCVHVCDRNCTQKLEYGSTHWCCRISGRVWERDPARDIERRGRSRTFDQLDGSSRSKLVRVR